VWVGSGGKDPRRARIRFLFRGEGHLFLSPEPEELDLSPEADAVLQFLRSEGACFFADLETGTELSSAELTEAVVDLVMAGLVTNDSLESLRGILAWSAEVDAPQRKPLSSLEAELAAWRRAHRPVSSPRAGGRYPPGRARLHSARRTVARRMEQVPAPRWPGRWGLVHRIGVWGRELPFEERLARQARQLLQCYGIVTRESLANWELGYSESGLEWGALYQQFQLMEMRGEVRRGYFVQGLPGVQFALPEAVERLREWTRPQGPAPDIPDAGARDLTGIEELVLLNACDPANLFGPAKDNGPALPADKDGPTGAGRGPDPARFTRIPANHVVLLRGRPVLLLETGGERLTTLPDLPPDTLRRAIKLAVDHVGAAQRRLVLSQWNGGPILENPEAAILERIGFRREALVYIWDGA
jgi:ATP-dependent Lhr-like helicase